MNIQPTICPARVVSRRRLAPGVVSVWLRAPAIARVIQPGQFVQVQIPNSRRDASSATCPEPFLRRPFSVAQQQRDRIRVVFREVGRGTVLLAATRPGDEWNLLGPLGKPAPKVRDRDIIFVGGGIGAAPLLFLAERICRENRVRVILGARNRQELILRAEFRKLGVKLEFSTDDGSLGARALVTDSLQSAIRIPRTANRPPPAAEVSGQRIAVSGERCPVVFACGPRPMLRKVKELTRGLESYAFWEERMGCGTGICYGCAVKRVDGKGYLRFCQEGPVLRMSDIEI